MARVWLARDEVLRRDVAIKEVALPSGLTTSEREELINRTLREARTAARLSHPNVVQIYDVVHTEDQPWIVMEYIRSRSLQQIITQDGPLPVDRAAAIGLAVLSALTAAHEAGVLHRDVKPGNVLIADDDRVVLTDFGLATFDGGEGSVTRPGLVWASPEYVAPERARLGSSTIEADLWSLGATLYAAVEGHSPFARSTAMATLTALATEKAAAPHRAGALKPVLSGLLRKDPRTRLGADEVERLLRRVAGVGPRPRPRPKRVPRQRRGVESAVPNGEGERDSAAAMPLSSAALRALPEGPTSLVGTALDSVDESATMIVADRSPRRRGRPRLIALAAILAIALAGTALVYGVRNLDRTATDQVEPRASVSASELSTAVPSGAPASLSAPRPGEAALPPGWGYWRDPTGFSIGVPVGWLVSRQGNAALFHAPGSGSRILTVEQVDRPGPDPVKESAQKESQGLASGQLRNYKQISLHGVQLFQTGAEWEYTFDDATGAHMHVNVLRFLTKPGRGYVLTWMTRDFDWDGGTVTFGILVPSFKPAP
jgi:hypothetical protein